jgi:hypothetical protein
MSTTQKKRVRKTLKKKRSTTVVVIKTPIAAKDTLFPGKVEATKELLRNAEFLDPRFGPGIGKG